MDLKQFYAQIAFDFVKQYSPEIINQARKVSSNPRQLIKSHILKHMEYGTISLWWDGGQLVGVCNYDIQYRVAYIKNCVIHPQYRGKNILQNLTIRALNTWPFLTHISFERPLKHKPRRTIAISQLLKVRTPTDARHAFSTFNTTSAIS